MCRSGVLAGAVVVLSCLSGPAWGIPAFSGAEGPGSDATGGRGYEIYHVTNLNESGPGSWRDAVNSRDANGNLTCNNRIVVFDVGGTIKITGASQSDQWFRTGVSNITIAGQTAPGNGIFIYGTGTKFTGNNVILRNVHFRPGPWNDDYSSRTCDGLWLQTTNSIIDHCSAEWATDEGMSSTDAANNMTIQYCFIAEGLNQGGHSFGGMIGFDANDGFISYHHNLFAHNKSRNPRIGNVHNIVNVVDFRNNAVYDWISNCGYSTWSGDPIKVPEEGDVQFINNYYIAGLSTTSPSERVKAFDGNSPLTGIYQSGNKIDPDLDGVFDGNDTGWAMFTGSYAQVTTPWTVPNIRYTETADDALQSVLNYAGADWWNRDPSVDARIANSVRTGGGTVPTTLANAGGYTYYPKVTRPADWDTDGDGMPNYWEQAYGLDPNVQDHNGDFDADGYLNIEEYLNELAAWPAPQPIVWAGGDGRYELITNWDIVWQPSKYDTVQINSGRATVGYLGQVAGTIYVANTIGSSAELAVTAGSLAVASGAYVGNASGGRGTLTLTGGTLKAGGKIILAASASSTGELKVGKDAYVQTGGLTINSGGGRSTRVGVEMATGGTTLIRTAGLSTLAGALDVQSLGGYRPREGDAFTIITATDPSTIHYSGNFTEFASNITLGLQGGLDPFAGQASGADYRIIFQGLSAGDSDGDHRVDTSDLNAMGAAWFQSGTWTWDNGDFNGDGTVDTGDLALMTANWWWVLPAPPPGQPVPEPATLALLALSAPTALARRRRG